MEKGIKLVDRWSFKLPRNNDTIPKRDSNCAVGYGLIYSEDVAIPRKGKVMVRMGSAISILICTPSRIDPRC